MESLLVFYNLSLHLPGALSSFLMLISLFFFEVPGSKPRALNKIHQCSTQGTNPVSLAILFYSFSILGLLLIIQLNHVNKAKPVAIYSQNEHSRLSLSQKDRKERLWDIEKDRKERLWGIETADSSQSARHLQEASSFSKRQVRLALIFFSPTI